MSKVEVEYREDLLSGKLIFEKVSVEEVLDYTKALLVGQLGNKISNVHVRKTSSVKEQYGLYFMLKRDDNESPKDALWHLRDHAFKNLGAKCTGCDVGYNTWLVK